MSGNSRMSAPRSFRSLFFCLGLVVVSTTPTTASAQVGSVYGVVHDSIGDGPLVDAAVFLWDTPFRTATDAEGRYRIDNVPAGDYDILFFHTRLGELGVSAGPRPLTVSGGSQQEVDLGTPSLETLVRSQCLIEERPEGAGAVAGRVVDGESAVPLAGAVVELSWSEEGRTRPKSIELEVDQDGWYRSCAVPSAVPILVSAHYYGRLNTRREFVVDDNGFANVDAPLYDLRPSGVTGRLVDAATDAPVEGAETWLRGTPYRMLTDGRGRFAFNGVPPGTYMLVTDHLAYGLKMDTLEVASGQELLVEMQVDNRPIEIAPLVVTTESSGPGEVARRRGGIVISREQIEEVRQRSRDASDVLRSLHVPGVMVQHNVDGSICVGFATGQVHMRETGCVPMIIFINDVRATNANLALRVPPDAIERMVIYKPVEAGNLFGSGANGVWMIYTHGN